MPAHRTHNPALAELAFAYAASKQNIDYHARRFGRDVVASPEAYFAALLKSSKASALRTWLSHPINRKRAELRLALFRQAGDLRQLRTEASKIQKELSGKIEELDRQARL